MNGGVSVDRVGEARRLAQGLDCWSGPVEPEQLTGGITNLNFRVTDAGRNFVVRIGEDIPVHQVMRFNEVNAAKAAFKAGISPEIVYARPGVIVARFIEGGGALSADGVRAPGFVARFMPVLKACHREVPKHLRGPVLAFWVFHVLRDYAARLREEGSPHGPKLDGLVARAEELERAVGKIDLVFGHNDLLPGNIIDDGKRLWLIDWEYSGFNSPLFDLANLASNSQFDEAEERHILSLYFDGAPDADLWRRYSAMKAASLLREAMWSMVSELHSKIAFDYAAYTVDYLARFDRAYQTFRQL